MANRRNKLVPGCEKAIDDWKYEIAAELGLAVGPQSPANLNTEFATELGAVPVGSVRSDYWGHLSSRETGAVGGSITKRLVEMAEQSNRG
ncbi:small, acid-soluble spore protein, alpha/beta type [Paenibacillus thermoaerophilus]|uniref:Small, acid-soluble spore protein, alpha/beta type n=1 Tax=Paenibacillus thermoaerophilus TaxID=1215385 RepID=A0ABW2V8U0_9BACL|nr:alpha/beta-type small acid-soluble spore protein [Paenibacillus thermoaerophilus]TMV12515.1 alpha/beta-type small acid-soluble spore protein [Paenibacillus thermoaerophilus]